MLLHHLHRIKSHEGLCVPQGQTGHSQQRRSPQASAVHLLQAVQRTVLPVLFAAVFAEGVMHAYGKCWQFAVVGARPTALAQIAKPSAQRLT